MDEKQTEIEFLKSQIVDLSRLGKGLMTEIASGIALLQELLAENNARDDSDVNIMVELTKDRSAKYLEILENRRNEHMKYYGQLDDDVDS